jgi:hypothetical protein
VTEHENDRHTAAKPDAGSEDDLVVSKETLEDLEAPVDVADEVRGQRRPDTGPGVPAPCETD